MRKEINQEMKEKFLTKGADTAHIKAVAWLENERKTWVLKRLLETMINATIVDEIKTICTVALQDGKSAKLIAERQSGLLVPNPAWMQYSSYCLIRDLWKERKKFLKRELEMRIGDFKKKIRMDEAVVDAESAAEIKEAKERAKREVERQDKLCREMDKLEAEARVFYHWEMLQNLRERREMSQQDREMKQLLKEEKKIQEAEKMEERELAVEISKEQQEKEAELTSR